ncbi:HAD family hydrolase [Salisediminibacterium halotolerans]|uniref:Cof subfamily of IIB subfamily of haloacid dehalogenase superfamily/HAD-superfamily hydrolase, subfamily IIB n=1 Tax=Salisediminibacterium halotolerans TaxID=517425 RepID=A0A1H9W9M4_9BACI|nr:HAD family hydrolase [Salisediminibacterium haloalkalitolerans]SES30545.1 hypothetical protein SAMN05444126_13010 [Salisediminibacterium haloalkalitolerans]
MIKSLALDMDGTLLDSHHRTSGELIELLNDFRAQGGYVFLATGRTIKEVTDVLPGDLKLDGIVAGNGMVVEAIAETPAVAANRQRIAEHSIDEQLIHRVVELARERELYYEIHPNEGPRFAYRQDQPMIEAEVVFPADTTVEDHEAKARKEAVEKEIHWVDADPGKSVQKVYFFSMDQEKISDWQEKLQELQAELPFSTSSSSHHNTEVMGEGVNKATGIQALLDYYQLESDQLLAVGDANNDLPMLKLAGLSAVMKNGSEEAKQEVTAVTDYTSDENGLYHFLKSFLGV